MSEEPQVPKKPRAITARRQPNPLLSDGRIQKLFDNTKYNTRNTIYGDENNWDSQKKLSATRHTSSELPGRA